MKSRLVLILTLFAHMTAARAAYVPRVLQPGPIGGVDRPVTVGLKPELALGKPGGALGYWGVGNGGDWLRIGFARAREYAAQVVLRIKPESLRLVKQPGLQAWIIDHQKYLAADILQTEHVWELEGKPTCAWTLQPSGSDKVPTAFAIQLSYPSCRQNVDSFLKAAQILIHESVHHFNGDETLADQVAIAVLDAWQNGLTDSIPIPQDQAPLASQRHTAVWTGEQMIVIGGFQGEGQTSLAQAAAYDPQRESWTSIGWPAGLRPRHDAQAVWTGDALFIWGGYRTQGTQTEWLFDGALYQPASKSWTLVAAPASWSPQASTWDADPRQTLVWTGDRAIVYGGVDAKTGKPLGALFDPLKAAWTPMNTNSSAAPLRIAGHSAVWTGRSMIVWGGYEGTSDFDREITDTGASYDPQTDQWTPIKAAGAPSPRAGHQAVWTGKAMIVFSGGGVGSQGNLTATGGLYNPLSDSWEPLQTELLIERVGHKAVWNGEEMLVLGGRSNRLKTYFGETYGFHPETRKWRIIGSGSKVDPRFYPSLIWTGSSALVWGGMSADGKSLRSGQMILP